MWFGEVVPSLEELKCIRMNLAIELRIVRFNLSTNQNNALHYFYQMTVSPFL